MSAKKRILEVKSAPLHIVGDGIVATADQAQGRAVPVLIVDCLEREDVRDIFSLHRDLGRLGNVRHAWARAGGSVLGVYLGLEFLDPVTTQVVIEFDLPRQAILVELILNAECFYFQSGKPGDRMITTDGAPRILVETLSTGFEEEWHALHVDLIASQMKGKGLSRSKRRQLAEEQITKIASLGAARIPQY